MYRMICAVTSLLLGLLLSLHAVAAPPVHYSITIEDKLIGCSTITASPVELDGRKLQSVQSLTTLKIALLGAERLVVRRSQTYFDAQTGLPVSFRVDTDTNGQIAHVESEFSDGEVRTWAYAQGEQKGEPVVTQLTKGTCILGSNNFAHWGNVLKRGIDQAKDGQTVVPVYMPDFKSVKQFLLKKSGSASIEVLGQTRQCDQWNLEGGGVSVYADADTGQLVMMELSAQKTLIKLAESAVVQALEDAAPQEMLAQNFVQSNVNFDDGAKVTRIEAEIDVSVFGSGPGNPSTILTTAMQKFDGQKEDARIRGSVVVRSTPYRGQQSPAFPTAGEVHDDLSQWLQPSAMIESDHPEIVALARQLTQDATTRWQAVNQVARWVNQEIKYTIADSPSARMALERRTGDCGPHSTLMVAMLRSLKIPAKLVGGVIFTPSFGGTFGQHAWVEVHMGDDGWVSMDPTTGEYEQISATHIKLFEGMGGVIPQTINVVEYEPRHQGAAAEPPSQARPWPWEMKKNYAYKYFSDGQAIGQEKFHFEKVEVDGDEAIQLNDTVDLSEGSVNVTGTTRLIVKANAAPVSFHRQLQVPGKEFVFDCEFADDVVKAKVSGAVNMTRDIQLKPGDRLFDNNLIGSFAALCTQLDLEAGKTVQVRTYHPGRMMILPLTFQCETIEKLKISDREVECFKCLVGPINNTFWITRDGQLVKVAQGPLVIELDQ